MKKHKFIFCLIIYAVVNFILYSITADNRAAFMVYKVLRAISMPGIIFFTYKGCQIDKE